MIRVCVLPVEENIVIATIKAFVPRKVWNLAFIDVTRASFGWVCDPGFIVGRFIVVGVEELASELIARKALL